MSWMVCTSIKALADQLQSGRYQMPVLYVGNKEGYDCLVIQIRESGLNFILAQEISSDFNYLLSQMKDLLGQSEDVKPSSCQAEIFEKEDVRIQLIYFESLEQLLATDNILKGLNLSGAVLNSQSLIADPKNVSRCSRLIHERTRQQKPILSVYFPPGSSLGLTEITQVLGLL
jgi:hypothetical protein